MDLYERVEKLERSARRWRLTAAALGLIMAALVVMGFDRTEIAGIIRAHRIEIADASGRTVVRIDTARGGSIVVARPQAPSVWIGADTSGDGYIDLRSGLGGSAILMRAMPYGGTMSIMGNGRARVRIHGLQDAITVFAPGTSEPVWVSPK